MSRLTINLNCGIQNLSRFDARKSWRRAVWPDLAKFCHFGNKNKVFGNSWRLYLVLGKILKLLRLFFCSWAIVHCCKKPNIEKMILPSGHTDPWERDLKPSFMKHFTYFLSDAAVAASTESSTRARSYQDHPLIKIFYPLWRINLVTKDPSFFDAVDEKKRNYPIIFV